MKITPKKIGTVMALLFGLISTASGHNDQAIILMPVMWGISFLISKQFFSFNDGLTLPFVPALSGSSVINTTEDLDLDFDFYSAKVEDITSIWSDSENDWNPIDVDITLQR